MGITMIYYYERYRDAKVGVYFQICGHYKMYRKLKCGVIYKIRKGIAIGRKNVWGF